MSTHMIHMGVGRNRRYGLLQQMLCGLAQARHAHAGIDQKVAVAATHMPDIAAHEWDHMRFP